MCQPIGSPPYTAHAGRRPAHSGGMSVQCEFATRLTPHVRAGGPRTQAEWLCNVSSRYPPDTARAGWRPAHPGGMAVQCEFATRLTPHVRAGGLRTQANAENILSPA